VQYNSEKANIWCACHGGVYDAKTGKNIAGPPPKPLKPLNVDVVDGQLIVSNPSAPPSAAQKS
jgi:cytochrome b6-f complex iron-sulfur subunit